MADQDSGSVQPDGQRGPGQAEKEPDVSNPAEVIRLANMFQALMVEVRDLDLDEPGRKRLFEVQGSAVDELKELLSDDLEKELDSLGLPIRDEAATGAELRIAQAQLVGWLNGVFQGMQAAIMAQQMGQPQGQLPQQGPQELAESKGSGQYL